MTDNKEREAFEAAWLKAYPLHEKTVFTRSLLNPHEYAGTRVNDGWKMWQAHAALAASQEKADPFAACLNDAVNGGLSVMRIAQSDAGAAPVAAQADMRECRHCGWMCAPNDAKSKRWYPLAEPVAAQASEPVAWLCWKPDGRYKHTLDRSRAESWATDPRNRVVPLFSVPQPSAAAVRDAARMEAFEEAARSVDGGCMTSKNAAATIRALKSDTLQPRKTFEEWLGEVVADGGCTVEALLVGDTDPIRCARSAWDACIASLYSAPQPSAAAVRDAALEEAVNAVYENWSATGLIQITKAIRALKSAPPQPAEPTDECGMTASDYARVDAEAAEQPSASPAALEAELIAALRWAIDEAHAQKLAGIAGPLSRILARAQGEQA